MNCAYHDEAIASAFCRNCGNAICDACKTDWQGAAHCPDCASKLASAAKQPGASTPPPPPPRYTPAEAPSPSGTPTPLLALVLGLIPGVGAVYNGQYAKGVFHVVIFGGLISLISSDATGGFGPLFGFLIALFYFYMPIEAYRTAKALQSGEPVDEFSGWIGSSPRSPRSPVAGIALIVLGLVILMHTMGFWSLREFSRYWPVVLILLGANMLYRRFSESRNSDGPNRTGHSGESSLSLREDSSDRPASVAEAGPEGESGSEHAENSAATLY